jgi:hypothetical protein
LKTTPTLENTLRSLPPQFGHSVRAASLNDWWMSNAWPHSVQV